MSKTMIKAKYPLAGAEEFLEVSVSRPERDPKSTQGDFRCACSIAAPDYEMSFYAHGIDELQCVWIALRQLRVEIEAFEKKTGQRCEYYYYQDFEESGMNPERIYPGKRDEGE